ncbi:MAG: M3 family peptidase, partial [Rikenellaceae bacterium]|nr:M3 family peptidase [Rikenellaceae bacterium]
MVYDNREILGLTAEQMRLLEKTYKSFARNGAALSVEDKEIYRTITKELSELSIKFDKNMLDATNAFVLHITDSAQLDGLPAFAVAGAAAEAKERGLEGWVVTLQYPSLSPFLTYSTNRELKEKL